MNDMKDILVGNPKEKDCPKVNTYTLDKSTICYSIKVIGRVTLPVVISQER